MGEVTIETLEWRELSASDLEGWEALRATHPHGTSPLLSPAFARLVSGVRGDLRVILARQGSRVLACMAVHVRPMGFARPAGAPFDDLSGPLIAPGCGLDARDLVEGAGLNAYSAKSAIVTGDAPGEGAALPYLIDVRGTDSAAYSEARRKEHAKRFKNFRRLQNKLEREKGAIEFRWGRPDLVALHELLSWKSQQFQRDGLLDITRATHSRAVLDAAAHETPGDLAAFGGFMVELRCGGDLVAGHFGIREGAHFHPWISAYRPEFAEFAPGMVLLKQVIARMEEMGLETYQLADGHGHYKKYFATPGAPTAPVSVTTPGLIGAVHGAARRGWSLLGAPDGDSVGARLARRMDHIAVCESNPVTRVRELALAVARRSRAGDSEGHGEGHGAAG